MSFKHKYTYDEKAKILLEYQSNIWRQHKNCHQIIQSDGRKFCFFIVYLTGSSSALRQILQLFFYLFIQLFFYLLLYLFFCSVSSPT